MEKNTQNNDLTMKTNEEKAKAYDEALKWMRTLYPGLHGATKEDAEHYFPELAESEDERIRKWMIDEIKTIYDFESPSLNPMVEKALAYLEKQKEQKLAEWSEEDEKMLNLAIEWAETMSSQFSFVDMKPTDFRKIASWLKSIRPHWKPSEEQMEALLNILHPDDPYYYELKSLYEQLKKL